MAIHGEVLKVNLRRFRPEDAADVHRLVRLSFQPMPGLMVKAAYKRAPVVQAATVVLPLVAAASAAALHVPPPGVVAVALLTAAAVPAVLWWYWRSKLEGHMEVAMKTDLLDVASAYSEEVAGPGSAFWVAELTTTPASPGPDNVGAAGKNGGHGDGASTSAAAAAPLLPATAAPVTRIVGCVALQRRNEKGKPLGEGASGTKFDEPPSCRDVLELRRMSVDTTLRRQGVASALMRTLTEHARMADPPVTHIILWTSDIMTAAKELYRRHGFEVTQSFTFPYNLGSVLKFSFQLRQF